MNLTTLNKTNKINLWHRRLGHYNINTIKNKLLKINIRAKCPICSNSKLKNFPHRKSHSLARSPLELVHMDLVGPVEESIHLNRYFLTILDDFSRFGWVIFLQNKSDVFDKFLPWIKSVENIFNKTITYIRTDNGMEFNNSKFKYFCAQKGIIHQFTTPYNPQQNGRAERLNGILISAAKSLLNDSKLSREFWECAVDTANYIHNRLPHSSINNKIPFEVLFKTKTDYSHFKVFGCRVFFFVPKSLRNKFDNNALPGIFLGYHPLSNAYKILNITNNQIIYSHSVEFFEDTPGNSKLSHSIPPEFSNFIPNSEIRGSDIHILNKFINPNTIQFNQQNKYPLHNSKISIDNNHTSANSKNSITNNDNANNDKNINSDIQNKSNKLNQISNIEIKHNNNYNKINYNKINDKLNRCNTIEKNLQHNDNELREPKDFDDILNLPDREEWLNAVNEELNNMRKLNVFKVAQSLPKDVNIVSCKWVLKYKIDSKGNIIKRKARLVARGFTQRYGIDYTFTFSPTLKLDSLRIIIAIAVQKNYKVVQIDVNAAYLNAELNEDIYIEAPKGHPMYNHGYLKLNKALYGLRQAGREWNETLNNTLIKMSFRRLTSEPCIYVKENNSNEIQCVIAVYVDDILLAGKEREIKYVKEQIKMHFNIKDIGDVDFIIGIKFEKCGDG